MIKSMFDRDVTYEQVLNLPSVYLIADASRSITQPLDVKVKDGAAEYRPLALYTTLENTLAGAESLGLRFPAWLRPLENLLNCGLWSKPNAYRINATHKILKGSIAGAISLAMIANKDYVTFDPRLGELGDPVLLISVSSLFEVSKSEQK